MFVSHPPGAEFTIDNPQMLVSAVDRPIPHIPMGPRPEPGSPGIGRITWRKGTKVAGEMKLLIT